MIATKPADRCFIAVWPDWRRPPAADGLIAVLAATVPTSWADEVLARDDRGNVVWAATGFQGERYGRATCERPGVHAVSLAAAGEQPARVAVALHLASHLGRVRCGGLTPARPYLTSPGQPATPDDLVRIPHLVTVRAAETTSTSDEVVWERTTRAAARQWLGGPLPDQAFVEAHLPDLLALRAAARAGQLPPTAAGQRLAALLHGRPLPLSIQLVYRRLDLFRVLLASDGEPT